MAVPSPYDYINTLVAELQLPYGDAFTTLQNYGPVSCMYPSFAGFIDYTLGNYETLLLGYLAQVWLYTAAKTQGDVLESTPSITGHTALFTDKGPVTSANISTTRAPGEQPFYGQDFGVFNFGAYQFIYPGGNGPLHRYGFQSHACYPEAPGATGIEVFPNDPTRRYLLTISGIPSTKRTILVGGKAVDPANNDYSGVQNASGLVQTTPDVSSLSLNIPSNNAGVISNAHTQIIDSIFNPHAFLNENVFVQSLYAYATEIWQHTVEPNLAQFSDDFPAIPGEFLYSPPHTFIKSAKLTCAAIPPSSHNTLGKLGVPYFGVWAPVTPDGWGDLQYINSSPAALIPPTNKTTKLWLYLFQHVTGTITLATTDHVSIGMTTPSGDVRLTDNMVTGLS